jgi:hypothetical protein
MRNPISELTPTADHANPDSRSCFYLVLICIKECSVISKMVNLMVSKARPVMCSPPDFRAEVNSPANGRRTQWKAFLP